jgi:hypothetical protein
MKFMVEIEVDWLDEDGRVDDAIKEQVLAGIENRVSKKVLSELSNRVAERIDGITNDAVNALLEKWLDREITVTDQWGDLREKGKVSDIIKARFDDFWAQKVDNYGKTGYGASTPRYQWFLNSKVEEECQELSKRLAKDVDAHMRKTLNAELCKKVSRKLVDAIGVDQMIDEMTAPKPAPGKKSKKS